MYENHKTFVECTNHSNVRALMKELTPPIIPYLGMYLSDILFVSQGMWPIGDDLAFTLRLCGHA